MRIAIILLLSALAASCAEPSDYTIAMDELSVTDIASRQGAHGCSR